MFCDLFLLDLRQAFFELLKQWLILKKLKYEDKTTYFLVNQDIRFYAVTVVRKAVSCLLENLDEFLILRSVVEARSFDTLEVLEEAFRQVVLNQLVGDVFLELLDVDKFLLTFE